MRVAERLPTFTPLAHRSHTAATPQQRRPRAAACSPRAAACRSRTTVAPAPRQCTPLITVPTPPSPPPSLLLHAALTLPSRLPHAAARSCSLSYVSPPLPPSPYGRLIQRLHTGATSPSRGLARVGPGGDGVAGRAGSGKTHVFSNVSWRKMQKCWRKMQKCWIIISDGPQLQTFTHKLSATGLSRLKQGQAVLGPWSPDTI